MALLIVIRRVHMRNGMSIREISRRAGLSRNTVRKYLTNGVVEPKYPALTVANKLDAFAPKLEAWLKSEAKKSRKQRRNTRQLFNDLVVLGFEDWYDRVAAFLVIGVKTNTKPPRQLGAGHFCPLRLHLVRPASSTEAKTGLCLAVNARSCR